MRSNEIIKYLREIVNKKRLNRNVVFEISIFGSVATNSNKIFSDVDVIIFYKINNINDYCYVFNLINYLKKQLLKKHLFGDIFIVNIDVLFFIINHFGLYLNNFLKEKIIISSFYFDYYNIKQKKLSILYKKDVLKSNAYLVLMETFNEYPTIFHEKRRKNLKNAYWLLRQFYEVNNSAEVKDFVKKRIFTIEKEDPIKTIKNDILLIKTIFSSASLCNLYDINIKILINVQIARYYLVDFKRMISTKNLKYQDFKIFIQKGLSIIIKYITVNNKNISENCNNNLQYLLDYYVEDNYREKKSIKNDYLILLNIMDNILSKM